MKGRRRNRALPAALVVALALIAAPVAKAAPGDVYVVDRSADAVWKLGPAGGDPVPLAQGVPPFSGSPYGMTLGPGGLLYVADERGQIFTVNRRTGDVQQIGDLDPVNPSSNPIDVVFDARRRLFVPDFDDDTIYILNPATGVFTPFFEGNDPGGGFNSVAIMRNGTIFVSDENDNVVYRLRRGVLTPIIENDPDLDGPDGILLSPDERFLYVGSFSEPRFFRYNVRTGGVRKFELPVNPYSLALLPSNRLIFSDENNADLDTVSRLGGATTPFSSDPDYGTLRDIVVEPRRCAGRFPTIVGTNAREVIKGSRFADVISTLGGNDLIRGLGGNDIVCAGRGRDRAFGGKGRDRLLGQAGGDRLAGGVGGDVCRGGPGADRQTSC